MNDPDLTNTFSRRGLLPKLERYGAAFLDLAAVGAFLSVVAIVALARSSRRKADTMFGNAVLRKNASARKRTGHAYRSALGQRSRARLISAARLRSFGSRSSRKDAHLL